MAVEIPQRRLPRPIAFALALTAGCWAFAARVAAERSAAGISGALHSPSMEPLLRGAFLVFLAVLGFTAIHWVATRHAPLRNLNGLPARKTVLLEWRLGALTGWALALAVVLPLVLVGDLTPSFWWSARGVLTSLLSLVTLLVLTLASEVIFRGYIFARLRDATSPGTAALAVSCLYMLGGMWALPGETRIAAFASLVFSFLLCLAYERTHALWLPWGLHFAWASTLAVIFGQPVMEGALFAGVVDGSLQGRSWLTGGTQSGPQGSVLAILCIFAAMVVVYRLTRDLAWQYTLPVLVGAGQAMDVAPPKAHTDMEAAAAAKTPLINILSTTPAEPSTSKAVREYLATDPDQR